VTGYMKILLTTALFSITMPMFTTYQLVTYHVVSRSPMRADGGRGSAAGLGQDHRVCAQSLPSTEANLSVPVPLQGTREGCWMGVCAVPQDT
jgi:hypothetical protein